MEALEQKKLEQLLAGLTNDQQTLLKDTINFGSWGDSDYEFLIDGKIETRSMYGYCTNDAKQGGHFSGRRVSAIFRSLYKKLGLNKQGLGEYFSHNSDWWGDGSGDMMFIRYDAVDFMEDWANK